MRATVKEERIFYIVTVTNESGKEFIFRYAKEDDKVDKEEHLEMIKREAILMAEFYS